MRHLVITDNADPATIHQAITRLRTKQLRACIQSTRDEIATDIDELLDLLPRTQDQEP